MTQTMSDEHLEWQNRGGRCIDFESLHSLAFEMLHNFSDQCCFKMTKGLARVFYKQPTWAQRQSSLDVDGSQLDLGNSVGCLSCIPPPRLFDRHLGRS